MGISEIQYRAMLARTTPRDTKPTLGPGPDRESELHDEAKHYCHSKGWLVVSSRMDRRTTQMKGVSDLIVVAPHNVFFIELKRVGQKLRPEQAAFRAHLLKLGWPHAVVHNMQGFLNVVKDSVWKESKAREANTEYGRERQEHAATKLALVAQQELCERLIQRAEKAELALVAAKTCISEREAKLRADKEKAEACCAEMRALITQWKPYWPDSGRAEHALSSDCGKDYVRKPQ